MVKCRICNIGYKDWSVDYVYKLDMCVKCLHHDNLVTKIFWGIVIDVEGDQKC